MATKTGCEWYGHCFCIYISTPPLCPSSMISEAYVLCCKCGHKEPRFPGLKRPC